MGNGHPPLTDSRWPVAHCQIAAHQLPITKCRYRLPITDCRSSIQLPIADHRLPITDCRSSIANYQLPIIDCQLPIADHRLPITDGSAITDCRFQIAD
jgi:hypothetical protein